MLNLLAPTVLEEHCFSRSSFGMRIELRNEDKKGRRHAQQMHEREEKRGDKKRDQGGRVSSLIDPAETNVPLLWNQLERVDYSS